MKKMIDSGMEYDEIVSKTELLKNYEKIQDKKILLEQKSDLENQLEILNKNIQIVNKFKTDTKIINEKIEELKPEEDFTKAEIQTLKAKIQTIQSEFFENNYNFGVIFMRIFSSGNL